MRSCSIYSSTQRFTDASEAAYQEIPKLIEHAKNPEASRAMNTYRIEEVIENFNVIRAIYQNTNISDKFALITAYGICKSLADLIDIKLENLDPDLDTAELWGKGNSKQYFKEKLGSFIGSFGYLAESTLKDEPPDNSKTNADHYLRVATGALPLGELGWGPFIAWPGRD